MVIYDVTTLAVRAGQTPAALDRIEAALRASGRGVLYACWYCEIGAVGDVLLIRGFRSASELTAERERLVMEGDVFGASEFVESVTSDTYAPFPFLPEMQTGKFGPFYEVRVYNTTRNGIPATIDLWRDAVPQRVKISPLVTAMYALDATLPRFMHIWPFPTLDARQSLRKQALESGHWPPKGGLVHLRRFTSSIYLPARFSPLA
jgi:hypothetical protein